MGASVGIAAAHRRHVSFSDKTAVECDRQEAARASSARAVQHESARPSCDAPQSSCLRSDANDFHLAQLYSSSSGSLSDCSETTVRADSCSEAMDPSAFDIIYRSDATEPEALSCWSCGTVPSSLAADAPAFVLSYYRVGGSLAAPSCFHGRLFVLTCTYWAALDIIYLQQQTISKLPCSLQEPAVAASVHWQRNTQGTGAAHSPHHHSAATLSSCLKQVSKASIDAFMPLRQCCEEEPFRGSSLCLCKMGAVLFLLDASLSSATWQRFAVCCIRCMLFFTCNTSIVRCPLCATTAAHQVKHRRIALQRPEGFKFQFADQAAAAASEAASRSLQGSIRAIEGRHALQRDAPVHSGRKRSRMISFS